MKLKGAYSLEGKLRPTWTAYEKAETLLCQQSPSSQGYVFPVVMCGCESWTVKKAERWKIDAFELWCWRRLLRVLDCKETPPVHPKGDQSWVFIERTDAEGETPILWPPDAELTHLKRPRCWERSRAGRGGDDRGCGGWMASLTQWTWVWVNLGVGDGQGGLACCSAWGRNESDSTEQLNWTELNALWKQPSDEALKGIVC